MTIFVFCIALFLIGLYAIVTKRNLIKIIIGFALIEYSVNLLFALIGFRRGALAPIITKVHSAHNFVDPIPQALVLTAIVIALGTTAVMLAIALRIYERYKTFDIAKIKKLKG
ncbi:cation:proton antiporter [candidate division WOR-3 bacterium 4484_100]|uniref:Cation:proton antiporter n=1 Tax=candidate division WOR-3 bacterium 4484_100 TaxID=1936077 RepID=A0A1V4QFF3_UNCW3|nr:MAG: cation:proton antiporter [candidate division WOR-3 bacterium 4484_100]